ncbi:MAG TPA: NCS2 family permease [Armatimonadota bacterium]|jgi:AGZA family xanthine/uracil permease-like MFS transporter
MLERVFQLTGRGTNARTEVEAGITTFLTMAYIIFVNPLILSNVPGLEGQRAALVAATCLAAAIPTLAMGLFTNTPYALAPGMGLNSVLTYAVCLKQGVPWQTAMGVVAVEGILIAVLVLTRTREAIMNAIPLSLKRAISVGIGLFITLIGMVDAGLVKIGVAAAPLTYGPFHDPKVLVATAGLGLTLAFFALRWKSALLLGIVGTTALALMVGVSKPPTAVMQAPVFTTMFHADVMAALKPALWATILAFVMSDFFDAMGTIIGVGQQAGLVDERGRLPRLREILFIDGLAATWGGLCGSSSTTTYIESASGVAEGGRTGLTAVTVGLLFLLALFFAPLVSVVPAQATAPALIIVGFLMLGHVKEIPFDRVEEGVPAFITMITIPFTYSIARGIGFGFISYLLMLVVQGQWRRINPLLVIVSLLFALSFTLGG